jgi:4'-phosphopantetheinyl transferase
MTTASSLLHDGRAWVVPNVSLCVFDLDDGARDGQSHLAADEAVRADSFRFARDRSRFVRGRNELRRLLGGRVGVPPGQLRFTYNHWGKPSLPGGPHFNLAHCQNVAVLAISDRGRVGIDIERVEPAVFDQQVADQHFSTAEAHRLRTLPMAQRPIAFFRCWARKEAFVKAIGGGLSVPLDAFEVSFEDGRPPALLKCTLVGAEPWAWGLYDLPLDGHVVALAVERANAGPQEQGLACVQPYAASSTNRYRAKSPSSR